MLSNLVMRQKGSSRDKIEALNSNDESYNLPIRDLGDDINDGGNSFYESTNEVE